MKELTCAEARELMLEAEPDELRGGGETALAAHIAQCAPCRTVAALLLKEMALLDDGIDELAAHGTKPKQRRPKRHWRWAALPLAAAAVLALLLVRGPSDPEVTAPHVLARLMFPQEPIVTPPAGKQALVMEKNNVTVVWLY